MNAAQLTETVKQLKGYNVTNVDFSNLTFTTDKNCVFAFDLTKTGLLKSNSVKFLWTVLSYANCNY